MPDQPVLLLTNDDGVLAPGIRALQQALLPLGRLIVVAPTYEQSATSHAITLDRPLRHIELQPDVHSIDGTPADCVYLALFEPRFLPRRPDLIVSGINHGANLGTSVFYSGTVAGAREGALRDIPAIAFSHDGDTSAPFIAGFVLEMVRRFLSAERPAGHATLLNVNFPKQEPRGVRVTRVGRHVFEENVVPRRDPGGREYFWIGGKVTDDGQVSDSDIAPPRSAGTMPITDKRAIDEGYISVTPLALEPTELAHMSVADQVAGF